MKPLTRNLTFGMQGTDVSELQRDLVRLGFNSMSQETTASLFGETTRTAVKKLQKQNSLEANGVVGRRTVSIINEKLGALPRLVRGTLREANGNLRVRAKVRAFDKGLRTETQLGEATCDAAGFFEIRYGFSAPDRAGPNVVVKAFASARQRKPIAVSPVVFDAPAEVTIDLVAGDTAFRGPSEFDQLTKDLNAVVERHRLKLADLVEDENAKDVSFLSG